MKYDITYSCGHTATIQLYGSTAERERKTAWMEREGLCPDCYREQQQEENARKAKEALEGISLPELTGTPKQIAYAMSRRDEFISGFGADAVKHIYHLEHLDGEEAKKAQQELDAQGIDYETAMAAVYSKHKKATACLHETDAGKLLDILNILTK